MDIIGEKDRTKICFWCTQAEIDRISALKKKLKNSVLLERLGISSPMTGNDVIFASLAIVASLLEKE